MLRVAGAYVVVGWGVLQVAEALMPLLGLPDWTLLLIATLLLVGLPLAMAVAWVVHMPAHANPELPAAGGRAVWLDAGLLTAAVLVVAVSGWQVAGRTSRGSEAPAGAAPVAASVAVLPFTTFSDDADDNYFVDGLTEELINSLAQLDGLKVPGRTSSFYFKNRNEDLREIGRQLGVANVLEGSVRRVGQRLRVTVQLVSAADGFHLWSRTYDRALLDVFAIQRDIAGQVASTLQASLLGAGAAPGATDAADTYPDFLLAVGLLRERTVTSLGDARALFESVLERAPDNVEAHAGYARATILLAGAYQTIEFEPAAAAAGEAVENALRLAPDSVAANLAAGEVYDVLALRTDEAHYQARAERALARAADLAPDDAEVMRTYGGLLVRLGRWDAAVQATRQAVSSDPLNRAARLQLAEALRGAGAIAGARDQLELVLELHPDYASAHLELGELLMETGELEAALPHLQAAHQQHSTPRATFALANVYLNLGDHGRVLETLAELDYSPLSVPLGEMIRYLMVDDEHGALQFAASELQRTGDRIWRPLVVLLSLNTGDLVTARTQLRLLEPAVLAADAEVSRLSPATVLLAGSLLMLEERSEQAAALLERLLAAYQVPPDGHDPVQHKLVRAHALALLGRPEGALQELEAARAQGFRTLYDFDNFLRLDRYPTFATMRDDPRFLDLLGQIEAANRTAATGLDA